MISRTRSRLTGSIFTDTKLASMTGRTKTRITGSFRIDAPQYVGDFESEGELPSGGIQPDDWATIKLREGESGFYAARWTGSSWVIGRGVEQGVVAFPSSTGWRIEFGDLNFPARYWDGDTSKFAVDDSGRVIATGLVAPATTGWRVEIGDPDHPIRYGDGTTWPFDVDNSGNVIIIGTIKTGETGTYWEISSDYSDEIRAFLSGFSNPGLIYVQSQQGGTEAALVLNPPGDVGWPGASISLARNDTFGRIVIDAASVQLNTGYIFAGVAGSITAPWRFYADGQALLPRFTVAQRPASPAKGNYGWDETNGQIIVYDGSAWLMSIMGTSKFLTQPSSTDALWDIDEIRLASSRQARGYCAHRSPAIGAASAVWGNGVTYGGITKTTNVPSSITFTLVGTDANVSSVAAGDISNRGFRFDVTQTSANVVTRASRTYVTVGA